MENIVDNVVRFKSHHNIKMEQFTEINLQIKFLGKVQYCCMFGSVVHFNHLVLKITGGSFTCLRKRKQMYFKILFYEQLPDGNICVNFT